MIIFCHRTLLSSSLTTSYIQLHYSRFFHENFFPYTINPNYLGLSTLSIRCLPNLVLWLLSFPPTSFLNPISMNCVLALFIFYSHSPMCLLLTFKLCFSTHLQSHLIKPHRLQHSYFINTPFDTHPYKQKKWRTQCRPLVPTSTVKFSIS